MSQSLLNKVWSFLVVVSLYLSLNVWSITQQWQLSLPGNPFKDGKTTPFGIAVFGIILSAPLQIITALIVHLYARRSDGRRWHERFPTFADFTIDTSSWEAKGFQVVTLFIFLAVPLLSISHFTNKMLHASVWEKLEPCPACASCLGNKPAISSPTQMLFVWPQKSRPTSRLVYDPDLTKDIAPDFFPIAEPWGLLLLSVAAVGFGVWSLSAVFRPQASKRLRKRLLDA